MTPSAALTLAGHDAHLVIRAGRPIAHLYVGPLTPSGYVPRTHRTVCRVRTRRLATLPPERRTSLDPASPAPRMCARCSASLVSQVARLAEPTHTRHQWAEKYAGLDLRDLWAQALTAETLEEIQAVAHASLIVAGHAACERRAPAAVPWAPHHCTLTRLIGDTRERLAGYPNRDRSEALTALIETGYAHAKAERIAAWKDREQRIARLGFNNATADESPRRRTTTATTTRSNP